MNYSQQFQSLIDNPEKSLFGFKDMSEEKQKAYSEAFYMQHPAPKNEFDEYGLRYDIDYLGKIGSDIVMCPVEFMANYVDATTKSLVDSNNEEFIEGSMLNAAEIMLHKQTYQHINATAFGNMAYLYINVKNDNVRRVIKEALLDIFVWKVRQYKSIIDSLNIIN